MVRRIFSTIDVVDAQSLLALVKFWRKKKKTHNSFTGNRIRLILVYNMRI